MPELPEAQTIASQLDRRLAGKFFGKVHLHRADVLHGDPRPIAMIVTGRRIECVHRRAKRVIIDLADSAGSTSKNSPADGIERFSLMSTEPRVLARAVSSVPAYLRGRSDRYVKGGTAPVCSSEPGRNRADTQPSALAVTAPSGAVKKSNDTSLKNALHSELNDPPGRAGAKVQLVFHLGMTGQLTIAGTNQPFDKHTHLRIGIRGTGWELRFRDPRRFGGVWCLAGGTDHVGRELSELGPEPLELTPSRFRLVVARPRQIKALLMDQRALAGLGNIYCDEALHAAGLHPLARADRLDARASGNLLRAIKKTLRRAIRYNGSTLMDYRTANGENGSFQKHHRVYNRAGRPCRSCGITIQRITAAGRSTFFCPSCQVLSTD